MITKYLNVVFATGDLALATKAVGDLVRAQGMSQKVGLRREGLYRSFGGNMGPGFDTDESFGCDPDTNSRKTCGARAEGEETTDRDRSPMAGLDSDRAIRLRWALRDIKGKR
jgi:hypothetical protein